MSTTSCEQALTALAHLDRPMVGTDFLLTWEKTQSQIEAVAALAACFNQMHREGRSFRVFDTGLAISLFRDNSTRTRFSFASAANALGLGLSELDEVKSQIAHGETVRETATMISFLAQTIGIRDDMYLGEGNSGMREFGDAIQEGYDQGVLHQRTTIVNLQCDIDHPTQSMADLLQLQAHFGSLEALRGRTLAMTWAYSPSYGKPLSVPQGIIGLLTRFGMNIRLAHPEGYDLLPDVVALAARQAEASGGSFTHSHSMDEAFDGADVVYPKSWAPFSVMQQRTALLKTADRAGLAALEAHCLDTNARFHTWECDERRMASTRDGNALYMHCLPADISGVSCARGEVAQTVFDRQRLATYRQAGFKPFVIAAMIFLSRMPDPTGTLRRLLEGSM